ncbi:MAG: chemotaxis protein CheW [Myxococcota bacterium]
MQSERNIGPADGGKINLACFEVRGRIYALDVAQLREIVRWQEATPLPHAPDLIDGVVDLRGAVIPVLDLGRALVGEASPITNRSRIVVVECDGMILGLSVEAAVDVMNADASALEDPPALAVQAGYDAVRAVVRRDGEAPVMVLSVDHLLECVYRSALPGGVERT